MNNKDYKTFSHLARKILFEDSYQKFTTQDFRAGDQFIDREPTQSGEPENSNPLLDLPVSISPQTATQLSEDLPPVDDPEYVPANSKELGRALSVLASRLPDRLVASVYKKFDEYVSRHSRDELTVGEEIAEEERDEAALDATEEDMVEKLLRFKELLSRK